ncbi:hypothetical protein FACS189499_09930 [Clostridia bacterium]|nr:hypothetical protein FACS189499_09930 [Clostridia bacterium]
MTDFQFKKIIQMICFMIEHETDAEEIKKKLKKLIQDDNTG